MLQLNHLKRLHLSLDISFHTQRVWLGWGEDQAKRWAPAPTWRVRWLHGPMLVESIVAAPLLKDALHQANDQMKGYRGSPLGEHFDYEEEETLAIEHIQASGIELSACFYEHGCRVEEGVRSEPLHWVVSWAMEDRWSARHHYVASIELGRALHRANEKLGDILALKSTRQA